jgi:hypothetical protein
VTEVVAVFGRACELAMENGGENINLDAGCHEVSIDADWWLAINPHDRPRQCSRGATIKPFQIYFEWRGWPAGFVSSSGGLIISGKEVSEANLLAALERAIGRGKNKSKGDPKPTGQKGK